MIMILFLLITQSALSLLSRLTRAKTSKFMMRRWVDVPQALINKFRIMLSLPLSLGQSASASIPVSCPKLENMTDLINYPPGVKLTHHPVYQVMSAHSKDVQKRRFEEVRQRHLTAKVCVGLGLTIFFQIATVKYIYHSRILFTPIGRVCIFS